MRNGHQRLFFVHDGRTNDLACAIELHASRGDAPYGAAEANVVVALYQGLSPNDAQDLLNFLRSLQGERSLIELHIGERQCGRTLDRLEREACAHIQERNR